jgi:hypothetical protein
MHDVEQYLERLTSVRGWLHPDSARIISDLCDIQRSLGVTGAVAEIGVKWGRLFILMQLKAAAEECCLAVDSFDDTVEREFMRNVQRWSDTADLTLFRQSSLEIEPAQILGAVGRCRMVSIDGGHEEDTVLNDLELVDAVLEEGGVVVIDDYFNAKWPGVAGATSHYLCRDGVRLRPFAISPGKLYLARPAYLDDYRTRLEERHPLSLQQTTPMFGSEVAVFGMRRTPSMQDGVRMVVRASPLALHARRARRVLRQMRR